MIELIFVSEIVLENGSDNRDFGDTVLPPGFSERIDDIVAELEPQLSAGIDSFYRGEVSRVEKERGLITISQDEAMRRDRNYLRLYLSGILLMHEQEPYSIVTAVKDLDHTTTYETEYGERKVRPAFVIGTNYLRKRLGEQFSLEIVSTLPQFYQEEELPRLFLDAGVDPDVIDDMITNGLLFSTKDGIYSPNPDGRARLGRDSDKARKRRRFDDDARPRGYPARYEISDTGEVTEVDLATRILRSIGPIMARGRHSALVNENPYLYYDHKLWALRKQLDDEDEAWANLDVDLSKILEAEDHRAYEDYMANLPPRRAFVYYEDFWAPKVLDQVNSRIRGYHLNNDSMFFLIDTPLEVIRDQNRV